VSGRAVLMRRAAAAAASVVVVVTGLHPSAGFAAAVAGGAVHPRMQTIKPVPGGHATAHARPAESRASVTPPGPGPAAGRFTLATSHTSRASVGQSGLTIRPLAVTGDAPQLRVEILSPGDPRRAGVPGLAVQLERTDAPAPATVAVSLAPAELTRLFGADFARRARWTTLTTGPTGQPQAVSTATVSPSGSPGSRDTVRTDDAAVAVGDTPVVLAVTTANPTPAGPATRRSSTSASAPLASATAMAGTAAPDASGTGTFSATSLSASTAWQATEQTGDFTYNYPLRVPPAAAGPEPDVAFSYDSGSLDGETAAANNQPSALGDGWSLQAGGAIERRYVPCAQDGQAGSNDQCWKSDNATVTFAGHSGTIVNDPTTGWHLQGDDNTKVEKLTGAVNGANQGEYWRLTTTDGTQYYFGLNHLPGWTTGNPTTQSTFTAPVFGNNTGEPCHGTTFATSVCTQAYRWNLDYVVDVHGNSQALYYTPETNYYKQNGTTIVSYIRGGFLSRIDYGMQHGFELTSPAPEQVVFTPASRCLPSTVCNSTDPQDWPDVPWDYSCTVSACAITDPTFWSSQRLDTVTTQYRNTAGSYVLVDKWSLHQAYPNPTDGTSAMLWLTGITHAGLVGGTATMPDVQFSGIWLQNRTATTGGWPALMKQRIATISTEQGGTINVGYTPAQCTSTNLPAKPETNTMRCFPQWWTPPGGAAFMDWFNKYPLAQVTEDGVTGDQGATTTPATETFYNYSLSTPAWRYDTSPLVPDASRTWSVWAGYSKVRVTHGDPANPTGQQVEDDTYFQGMDGDKASPTGGTKSVTLAASNGTHVTDSLWWAGQALETVIYNGMSGTSPGPMVSDAVTTPWASAVTANDGVNTARHTGDADTTTYTALSAGGNRVTDTKNTYDSYGRVTAVDDLGDTSTAGDDRCTRTSYADNPGANRLNLPADVNTVGVTCTATPNYHTDTINDTRSFYDGATTFTGQVPTKGDLTQTQEATSYTGTTEDTAVWQTAQQNATYDALGRQTGSTDALGRTSTTSYTPSGVAPLTGNVGPLTQSDVADAAGLHTITQAAPAWGTPTSVVDPNQATATITYDPLGRRSQVWLPGRAQATYPSAPSTSYSYTVSTTGTSAVGTTTLNATGNTVTSYTLYDGLGRVRQTQVPAEAQTLGAQQGTSGSNGTLVSDTVRDTLGQTVLTNGNYLMGSVPSAALLVPGAGESNIATQNDTIFDGAGRATATVLKVFGTEKWRTTNAYRGDHVDTTPPTGGTATTTYLDARGNTSKQLTWHGGTPTGTADTLTYGYDHAGRQTGLTDTAGDHWSWTYNLLGQQTTSVDPNAGTTTASYDLAGRVLTVTDNRNQALTYSYDALDHRTGEYAGTSTSGTQLAGWTYSDPAVPNGKEKLSTSTRYTPTGNWTESITGYDSAGNPTGTKYGIPAVQAAPAATYTTNYTYNPDQTLATQTDPAMAGLPAETLTSSYTTVGNLAAYTGRSDYLMPIAYNALGQLGQTTHGYANNYLVDSYTWENGTGRLTGVEATTGASSNNVAANRAYTFDNAGKITQVVDTASTSTDTQCFTYDWAGRLGQAWTPTTGGCTTSPSSGNLGGPAPYWQSYTYDALGDRTSIDRHATTASGTDTNDTYAYPTPGAGVTRPNAVTAVTHATAPAGTTPGGTGWTTTGTDTYAYDADGAMTTLPGQTLTWDAEHRLGTTHIGTATQTDTYDASGTLLAQTDPTTGTTLLLGDTELHYAPGASTARATRTYTALGHAVAVRTVPAGSTTATVNWFDVDPQSTATVAENGVTAATIVRHYDPFGNSRDTNAPTWPDPDHGFLGAPTNPWSTVTTVHLGARDYQPSLGRFTSLDPILQTGNALNGYSYADNSPITLSDPSGQRGIDAYGDETGMGMVTAPAKARAAYQTYHHHHKPFTGYHVTGYRTDSRGRLTNVDYGLIVGKKTKAVAKIGGQLSDGKPGSRIDYEDPSWKEATGKQEASNLGIFFLTVLNFAQGGLDPLTDGVEAGVVGVAEGAAEEAASGAAETTAAEPLISDSRVIARGGQSAMPNAGEVFSGAQGRTVEEAGQGVVHGSFRSTTAGEIRAAGGSVEPAPEFNPTVGEMNYQHVDVCLGGGACEWSELTPNVPKNLRFGGKDYPFYGGYLGWGP